MKYYKWLIGVVLTALVVPCFAENLGQNADRETLPPLLVTCDGINPARLAALIKIRGAFKSAELNDPFVASLRQELEVAFEKQEHMCTAQQRKKVHQEIRSFYLSMLPTQTNKADFEGLLFMPSEQKTDFSIWDSSFISEDEAGPLLGFKPDQDSNPNLARRMAPPAHFPLETSLGKIDGTVAAYQIVQNGADLVAVKEVLGKGCRYSLTSDTEQVFQCGSLKASIMERKPGRYDYAPYYVIGFEFYDNKIQKGVTYSFRSNRNYMGLRATFEPTKTNKEARGQSLPPKYKVELQDELKKNLNK